MFLFFSVVVTGCNDGGGTVSTGSLKFPDIKTSIGVSDLSSFKSTGKFTCQVPGYYYIAVTLSSADASTGIKIMRNSTAIHWQYMTGYTKEQSYWTPGAAAVSLELKSNDIVWIKLVSQKLFISHVLPYSKSTNITLLQKKLAHRKCLDFVF
ncbi:unnamed protein product [Mytilus edulis]|uniref:C1q domain-containing protein n=1 Tax=Mytilus edulis TaxID=6550 RepID=A0A8S3QFV9_MYTED|nr:unnamed protein product [Mytilus edulis]